MEQVKESATAENSQEFDAVAVVRETSLAQRENALLQSTNEFLQSTLDALSAHIAVLDESGTILVVNKAWRNFADANGYPDADYGVGKNYFQLCETTTFAGMQEIPQILQGLHQVLSGECSDFSFEYPYQSPTQRRWFVLHVTRFEAQGHSRLVLAHENITTLKLMEEALTQQMAELSRSNTDLERFAYIASHDLQEPLRMVASFTQLLAKRYRGRLDSDADEFIHYAVSGAKRMQQLIDDLLIYSRLSTRGEELSPANLGRILEESLNDLRGLIEESGAIVTYEPLPTLSVDASQIDKVFQNLIANAIKFHSEEKPHVHISARQQENEWVFAVRDNGIGIAPEYFERIFVVFQRLHTQQEYAGTGIGLAICKRIIERHQGRIWVESQAEKGSIFYFTLPITKG